MKYVMCFECNISFAAAALVILAGTAESGRRFRGEKGQDKVSRDRSKL